MSTRTGRDFAIPVFRGGRFDTAALPIDVLSDLAAYRDLIVALAKHLFRQRHPERKRLPKGFIDTFELSIRTIEQGSTIPVLARTGPDSPNLPLINGEDDFTRARDLVEEVLEAGARDAALPVLFPAEFTRYFNQFGRGLREGEHVELRRPGGTTGPRLDKDLRKKLIVRNDPRYEGPVDLTARIDGGTIKGCSAKLELETGAIIDVAFPEPQIRQVLSLVDQRVRVVGLGLFDRADQLESLLEVDDLISVEDETAPAAPALRDQFGQLTRLGPGWYEPDTPSLDPAGLDALERFLTEVTALGLPVPHLYPTPEAEVRAEWSGHRWELSSTFDLLARTARLHATSLDTDEWEELELRLSLDTAATDFAGFVRKHLPRPGGP